MFDQSVDLLMGAGINSMALLDPSRPFCYSGGYWRPPSSGWSIMATVKENSLARLPPSLGTFLVSAM